jgi:hypothetical protein
MWIDALISGLLVSLAVGLIAWDFFSGGQMGMGLGPAAIAGLLYQSWAEGKRERGE